MKNALNRRIDLAVIGCSAGGIDALKRILSSLPKSFPKTIVVVQHIGVGASHTLTDFFQSISQVSVCEAEDQIKLKKSTVYFAPPGYHLMISQNHTFEFSVDEPVRFSRPSINVLFETAAEVYRSHVLGILLTGANDDGADGLRKINLCGGVTIAQDPSEAEFAEMPKAAIRLHEPDFVLAIDDIIRVLHDLK